LVSADVPRASQGLQAEAAPGAQESPRSEAPELLDQVVLGIKGKLDARTGKAEIRMDPPNLGTVKVSVSLDQGLLTAQFHSESDVVRNLLRDNLEKLKTVLESQGVTVDRLAVSAPADAKQAGQQGQQAGFGSAAHDGRSAGQNQQDARSRQRSAQTESFSRMFEQVKEQPLDLVA
jgi:flagellar hook-length control protein FliK